MQKTWTEGFFKVMKTQPKTEVTHDKLFLDL